MPAADPRGVKGARQAHVGIRRDLWGSSNQSNANIMDKVFFGVGVMFFTFSATFIAIPLYDMF